MKVARSPSISREKQPRPVTKEVVKKKTEPKAKVAAVAETVGKTQKTRESSQKPLPSKGPEGTKVEPVKTARQLALEETGPQGVSPEVSIIHGAEMEPPPILKLERSGPFQDFENLPVPTIHPSISTSVLQRMCRQVKLQGFLPYMYTTHCAAWELYESAHVPPPQPKTDPTTIRDPMLSAYFDEIWCPIPADSKEAEFFLPPTFSYMPTEKCS